MMLEQVPLQMLETWAGAWVNIALETTIRGSILLAVAGVCAWMMTRCSAALRHLVWLTALLGVLLLPLCISWMPAWRILPSWAGRPPIDELPQNATLTPEDDPSLAINDASSNPSVSDMIIAPSAVQPLRAPDSNAGTPIIVEPQPKAARSAPREIPKKATTSSSHEQPVAGLSHAGWLMLGWLAGTLAILTWSLMGKMSLWRLERQSQTNCDPRCQARLLELSGDFGLRRPVNLLESRSRCMPMTWGIRKPVILLPDAARVWSDEQLRAVLLHELAHIRRHDVLILLLARCIFALHWFNPLMWIAQRRLRDESEQACDDVVIRHGALPPDYADHVLRVTVNFPEPALASRHAVSMARMSSLEKRLRTILDPRKQRSALRRRSIALLVMTGLCLLLPLSALQAIATDEDSVIKDFVAKDLNHAIPERSMTIRITGDEPGAELRNMRLKIYSSERDWEIVEVGDDGEYRFSLPDYPIDSVSITAMADGRVGKHMIWKREHGALTLPETYAYSLPRGTTIGGVTVDEDGEPVAGAMLRISHFTKLSPSDRNLFKFEYLVQTDVAGRWVCDSMPSEFSRISINEWHPDYISRRKGRVSNFHENTDPSLEDFRNLESKIIFRRGRRIAGRVVNPAGDPVAGASIAYGDLRTKFFPHVITETDAQGRYHFHVDPGEIKLAVFAEGLALHEQQFEVDRDLVLDDMQLDKGGVVSGRVVDGDGLPLAGVKVSVDKYIVELWTPSWSTLTDDEGWFTWRSSPETPLSFSFSRTGFMPKYNVMLAASDESKIIELDSELVAYGSVTDAATGEPISSFKVTPGLPANAEDRAYWDERNVAHYVDGSYEHHFQSTHDRGQYLLFEAVGFEPAQSRLFEDRDGRTRFDVTLKKEDLVRGVVQDPYGVILSGVTVAFSETDVNVIDGELELDAPERSDITDADGAFDLLGSAIEGGVIVAVHDLGYATVWPDRLDGPMTIQLSPWSVVEGIHRAGNEPVSEGRLWIDTVRRPNGLEPETHFRQNGVTDAQGRFRFNRIPEGRSMLVHSVDRNRVHGAGSVQQQFSIGAGETLTLDLGGSGRPVVGRMFIENGEPADLWQYARGAISRVRGGPPRAQGFVLDPEGRLRIDDVEPGEYRLRVEMREPLDAANSLGGRIARGEHTFAIDPIVGGRTDEPLDLGRISVFMIEKTVVDLTLDQASSMRIVDLDGDGDGDIVSSSFVGNSLFWWKNTDDNGTAWTRIDIDTAVIGAGRIAIVDLDNDSDLDIVGTATDTIDGQVFWWENTNGDATAWPRHDVELDYPEPAALAVADIDGDFDLDIAVGSRLTSEVVWWENATGDATTWVKRPLASIVSSAPAITFATIDDDTYPDLVVADVEEGSIAWWANNRGDGTSWTEHVIDGAFAGAKDVFIANLDGDDDLDVVASASYDDQIAWWENTLGDGSSWIKHDISGFFNLPHSVEAADFDQDGDLDVFGAGQHAGEVNWWENVNGDGLTWSKHVIWSAIGPTKGATGDLNHDGVPDFVAHNQFTNVTLAWINRIIGSVDGNSD